MSMHASCKFLRTVNVLSAALIYLQPLRLAPQLPLPPEQLLPLCLPLSPRPPLALQLLGLGLGGGRRKV